MNLSFKTLLPLFFVLALLAGVSIGLRLKPAAESKPSVLGKSELTRLDEILGYINYNYVDTVNTENILRDLIQEYLQRDEVVEGIFARLDPHSSYMPASSLLAETENLQGNFEGIGIEFNIIRDTILVVSPISGGPSEMLGIRSGDRIVMVEDSLVAGTGVTEDQVRSLLRGPKGSLVRIAVLRLGEPELIPFSITRDQIPLYSLDVAYMVDEQTGYIKLNRFSATTVDEFISALESLKGQGMKQLLLDLRGNPGGYLIAATRLADELLSGRKLIVYTQGKSSQREEFFSGNQGRFEQGDIVVLIDEGSASASEIVAGALQDHGRAAIVGRRSFGKGLVQEMFSLRDSSAIRLTIARYYTPGGRCIQRPYDQGVDAYYEDYLTRLQSNGDEDPEGNPADLVDYGIFPDLLIPADTTADRRAFYRLYNSGLVQRFAYDVFGRESNRIRSYASVQEFSDDFEVSDEMWARFELRLKEAKVLQDMELRERIRPWIEQAILAQVARQAWKSEGFYPMFQVLDQDFLQAYELLRSGQARSLMSAKVN